MAILGLMTTEELASSASLSARRNIFYQYPEGASPLMGLLSMMEEETSADKSEFGWEEKRNLTHQTTTVMANSAGPFTDTTGSAGAVGTDLTAAGWSKSINTSFRVKLANVSTIQERDVLMFRFVPGTSSSFRTFQGLVTAVYSTPSTVDILLTEAVSNALNTTAANGIDVIMVGSAAAEGDRSKTGFSTLPLDVYNYTQIFRHAFSFSRSALKMGLKWDSTGTYKHTAKDISLKHMKALEYAALFGQRAKQTGVTTADNETSVRRFMGGITWFLKQWDLGNTANGGVFDYRPGGSNLTSADWKTSDEKRYIDVNGNVTKEEFELLIERAFRFNDDISYEKICLCGGGLLSVFNRLAERESFKVTKLSSKEAYGMNVTSWETIHGTLHFKSHPLLNETPVHRYSGFILNTGSLRYTPLNDSDTDLLKNRQPRDYDGRKDEWLTDAGIEVRFPERHMFIDRLTGITA